METPGMLEDLLKQSRPGVNPELEDMVAKLMMGSGSSPQRATNAVQAPAPAPSALGTGAQAPAAPAGGTAPMAPEEANLTYQALIRKGVPPQIAQQAIANPQLLRDLLGQLYRGAGPQEQPPALASGTPGRMSAPGV